MRSSLLFLVYYSKFTRLPCSPHPPVAATLRDLCVRSTLHEFLSFPSGSLLITRLDLESLGFPLVRLATYQEVWDVLSSSSSWLHAGNVSEGEVSGVREELGIPDVL